MINNVNTMKILVNANTGPPITWVSTPFSFKLGGGDI